MVDFKTAAAITIFAIHVVVILRALLVEGRDPYARVAWLFLLVTLPGLGVVLYLLFGEPWVSTDFRSRSRRAYDDLLAYAPRRDEAAPALSNPFRTCEGASRWPVAVGNKATVALDSDAAIATIVADIDSATRSVHLSIYIWLGDHNGTKVVEAVCRAAVRQAN